jgi:ribosomal protein L37E
VHLLGFEFPTTAAKSKREIEDDAPTHASMKDGTKPVDRRAPSTDQKKTRRAQQAKTADSKMASYYLFNDDDEPVAGPYETWDAAESALNTARAYDEQAQYIAAGPDDPEDDPSFEHLGAKSATTYVQVPEDSGWNTSTGQGGLDRPYSRTTLNVYKLVDEPNEWGGRGRVVSHPEWDGLEFDSPEEARQFQIDKGLVVPYTKELGDAAIERLRMKDRLRRGEASRRTAYNWTRAEQTLNDGSKRDIFTLSNYLYTATISPHQPELGVTTGWSWTATYNEDASRAMKMGRPGEVAGSGYNLPTIDDAKRAALEFIGVENDNPIVSSKTSELGEPAREQCPRCGSAQMSASTGYCPQCGYRKTSMKESSMNDVQREGEILESLAHAGTIPEQAVLVAELNDIRDRRAQVASLGREIELGDAIVSESMTPVLAHSMHTADTDWVGEAEEHPGFDDNDMLTEATLWFQRTSPEVLSDRDEFAQQAMGYAHRFTSGLGLDAPAAKRTFLDHVGHLHRLAENESGNAESALPEQVPLDGHDDVLDNFQPPVAPENAGVSTEDISSQRATVVQENAQEQPETGGSAAPPIADPSGKAVSGLPNVNSAKVDLQVVAKHYNLDPDELFFEGVDHTAGTPTGDNADAVSSLPDEPTGDKVDKTMWPWEEEMEAPNPSGAADVAGVHTPGQSEADYPQPKSSALQVEARVCSHCLNGNHSGTNGTPGCSSKSCSCSCGYKGNPPGDASTSYAGERKDWTDTRKKRSSLQSMAVFENHSDEPLSCLGCGEMIPPRYGHRHEAGGGLDNLGDAKAPPFGKDDDDDDEKKEARRVVADEGQTCEVCGHPIERDPSGEEPRTWHHSDGEKHDHEAKPKSGGDSKESHLVTAYWYCNTHNVAVGDGNRDTHAGCKLEERKSAESAGRYSPVPGEPFRFLEEPKHSPEHHEYKRVFPNGVPMKDEDLNDEQREFLKRKKPMASLSPQQQAFRDRVQAALKVH